MTVRRFSTGETCAVILGARSSDRLPLGSIDVPAEPLTVAELDEYISQLTEFRDGLAALDAGEQPPTVEVEVMPDADSTRV